MHFLRRLSRIPTPSSGAGTSKDRPTSGVFFCRRPPSVCLYNTGGQHAKSSLTAVNLAYSSYESTTPVDTQNPSPVIIVHGLLGSKVNWNSIAKALHQKTKKKVITVDARNHGDSPHSGEHSYMHMAEDIFLLMKGMGIKEATLMGHSMGGRAVMAAALQKVKDLIHAVGEYLQFVLPMRFTTVQVIMLPSLVDRMVVVDVSPTNSPSLNSMQDFLDAMKAIDLPSGAKLSQVRKAAGNQLQVTISDPMVRQFVLTNLVEENGQVKWRCNLDVLADKFVPFIAQFPRDLMDGRSNYSGRSLFIGGANSDYIRPSDHDSIRTLFPKAEFVYIEDAGHWVHSEKPQEFLEIVTNFVQQPREEKKK